DPLTGSGHDESVFLVGHDEQRLEAAEHTVAAPILRELDGGARHVAGIALELLLEFLEQGHRVGGGAGEPGDDSAAMDQPNFLRVRLHDGFADGHLAITAYGNFAIAPDGKDGRCPHAREWV